MVKLVEDTRSKKINLMKEFISKHPNGTYEDFLKFSGETEKFVKKVNFYELKSRAKRMLNIPVSRRHPTLKPYNNKIPSQIPLSSQIILSSVKIKANGVVKEPDNFKTELKKVFEKYTGDLHKIEIDIKKIDL